MEVGEFSSPQEQLEFKLQGLETRTCKCGCWQRFRVMPDSKQEYAGLICIQLMQPASKRFTEGAHEYGHKRRGRKPSGNN